MCSSANDREAGNEPTREIFVEKCPNLRAGHGTLEEKMVLKFDDAGNVMYKQLANNLLCKQLRNMNKK